MTPSPMRIALEFGRQIFIGTPQPGVKYVTLDDALRYAEERVAQALAIDAEYRAGLQRDLANEARLAHQAHLRHQANTQPQPADRTAAKYVTLDDALRYAEERVAQALAIDAEYRAGLQRDLANEARLAHQAFLRHQASTRPQPAADRTEWPRF